MELSGFHVCIHSDDEQLKEHSIEISPDGKKATCWITSESGKEFIVKYWDGKSSVIKGKAKAVDVHVDGHDMECSVSLPRDTNGEVTGVSISKNEVRPFVFADIRTTDEDTTPGDTCTKPDEIGTISIQVFLIKNLQPSEDGSYRTQDHPPAAIDERAKKVGEHCVSLGDARPCGTSTHYTMVYNSKKPDLVFEFRYRSMAMLQALGIIPPPKREAPPIIDLSDDGDTRPPPKRQRTTKNEHLIQSMQVELERLRHRVNELEGEKAGPSGVKKEVIKHDPADIIDLT